MNFLEYAEKIRSFGREISMDAIIQTRNLIAPLLTSAPFPDVKLQRDVSYGNNERHRLDIFTSAEAADEDRPVLIFIHGGGFVGGDKYTPDTPFYDNIGTWAVRNGFNAVNMTYRLAPEHQWPSGVEDIHAVIQFIKRQGSEFGISDKSVFLMGQSAGAAHAAHYVAHPEIYADDGHGLQGLILLSGLYNFCSMQVSDMERSYLGTDEALYAERSSLKGLLETDLPLLITTSECDPAFFEAQALELLSALQKQHQQMPSFVHMTGQNHMSSVMYLGLEGDLLAPQLKDFIFSHS